MLSACSACRFLNLHADVGPVGLDFIFLQLVNDTVVLVIEAAVVPFIICITLTAAGHTVMSICLRIDWCNLELLTAWIIVSAARLKSSHAPGWTAFIASLSCTIFQSSWRNHAIWSSKVAMSRLTCGMQTFCSTFIAELDLTTERSTFCFQSRKRLMNWMVHTKTFLTSSGSVASSVSASDHISHVRGNTSDQPGETVEQEQQNQCRILDTATYEYALHLQVITCMSF